MVLLGLLAVPALAHIPHENVWALAPAPNLDASAPWILVYLEADQYMMSRSLDGGETWGMIGGEPLQDEILDAGQLTSGTVVILTTTRYWYSNDWGDSWTEAALPATGIEAMYVSDRIFFGGSGGIWSGSPGGTFTRELSGSAITAFGPGPTAVTSTGRVRRRSGSAWSDEGYVAADLTAAAFSAVGLYAGTASGTVYRKSSGAWTACGAIPDYGGDASFPDIRKLGFSGTSLVALPAKHGPVATNAACAAWSDRGTNEEPYFAMLGGAADAEEVWRYFGVAGSTWVAAGWQGVTVSPDRGVSWDDPQVVPPDTTAAILYNRNFPDDPRIWFSRFDQTVMYTDDGGATLDAPSHGLSDLNVQFLHTPTDPAYADTLYAVVNFGVYRSDDGGDNWTEIATSYPGIAQIAVWDDPDHLWLVSGPGLSGPVETTDGGATWTPLGSLRAALGWSSVNVVHEVNDTAGTAWICVGAQNPNLLVCSDDGGASWSTLYSSTGTRFRDFVAVPESGRDRIVLADNEGVWATDDWGATWSDVTPFGDDLFTAIERAPDGTLYAACETGRLAMSTDGGDTWTDLGLDLTSWTYDLAARPDWAADTDEVLIGTHDGAWVLRDATGAAPTLSRWMDVQRVDDWSEYLRCDGCLPSVTDLDAAMDTVQPITSADTAWTIMRGETVRVYGGSDGASTVELVVDGVSYGTFGGTAADVPSLLAEATGLGSGDHLVELVGVGGGGVMIDYLEGDSGAAPIEVGASGGGGGSATDVDGDGHDDLAAGGDDCDDADPAVHPGATETWYDGIDQDCSGGSDYDQDLDGWEDATFGGADCDDTEPAAYPGAFEVWYDGIDADCSGGSDYDQDADGAESSTYGGTDCDDTSATIWPGATETWYDGVDQNCDGRNDYDRDGDSYLSAVYGGTDCDDGRASVNPGRTEIRGNSMDENCNGSLLN